MRWGACSTPPQPQGKAKQWKEKQRQAKQWKGKHKQSKSNSDATRGTYYPRARVPHVTLGRARHMLPQPTNTGDVLMKQVE